MCTVLREAYTYTQAAAPAVLVHTGRNTTFNVAANNAADMHAVLHT